MNSRIEKPISMKEVGEYFKTRGPLEERPINIERRFHVASDKEPEVNCRLERVDRGDGQWDWEVIVDIANIRAGGRAKPPPLRGESTRIERRNFSEEELSDRLLGFVPDHLG